MPIVAIVEENTDMNMSQLYYPYEIIDSYLQSQFCVYDGEKMSVKEVYRREYASDYESGSEGKFYENFKRTLCVVPSDDSNLNEIIATLDFLTGGMSEKLSAGFPSLTKRELCYCLLLVSGFSRNSIRIAMGHGKSNSIYNMRSKIREKLGLSDADSLDGFLKGFGDIGDKSA